MYSSYIRILIGLLSLFTLVQYFRYSLKHHNENKSDNSKTNLIKYHNRMIFYMISTAFLSLLINLF